MKLEKIYAPIEDGLSAVEAVIEKELDGGNGLVGKMNSHLLAGRGKRLRAALVLFSAGAAAPSGRRKAGGGKTNSAAVSLAAAIELIHTATLIHDDIIDAASTRRRRPAINSKWGNEISVVFGDYILTKAFGILARLDNNEILKRLSHVTDDLCQGELKQINERFNLKLSEEDYLDIIDKKTASLMSACCELGAFLVQDGGLRRPLSEFGQDFGMAFQIIDDCLDITGDEAKTGKPLGKDISEGELTIPIIYILKKALPADKKIMADFINSRNGYNFSAIKGIVEKYDAISYAARRARSYIERAKNRISCLEESCCNEGLVALCDYVTERKS